MDLAISGRVAIVTAASRGLGRASADALAAEGARIVLSARGEEALESAEADLRASGSSVIAVRADTGDPATPELLVAAALENFGRLDIVVANAGGPPPGRALDVTDDQLLEAFNDNFLGSARLVRQALTVLRPQGWGRICCIASFSVKQPLGGLALSNTARTSLWAWVKTAAADLTGSGVTLNLACPGPHATERMGQLGGDGPAGDPADFGRVVAFLCSEPASFVNGEALVVDGGLTSAL